MFLALLLVLALSSIMLPVAILIRLSSKGPAIHWSRRVGRNSSLFLMPKFRTMHTSTPDVASHLLSDPKVHITALGQFLRKTSLDELPQIYSILKGDMSFIGPRPALWNQADLINLRKKNGVDLLRPGVTGWAQVNGRDKLSIQQKVELDRFYLENQSLQLDMRILGRTFFKVISRLDVSH